MKSMKSVHPKNTENQQIIYHLQSRSKQTSWIRRNSAIICIGIAIVLVISVQWYFIITSHDVHQRQPHDLFLSSFGGRSSSSSSSLAKSREKQQHQNQQRPKPKEGIDYITSPICGACTRSMFDHRSCYTIMERDLQKQKKSANDEKMSTIYDAATKIGKESNNCKLCDPITCWKYYFNSSTENYGTDHHQSKYWKFDKVHPDYTNPTTFTLTSIPNDKRIPPSRFDDIGTFFQEKYEHAKAMNASIDYLVEYNPGLVPIPIKMKEQLPPEATYLVSLRVTPANNCFSTQVYANLPKDVWTAVYHTSTNHLGLALLDENYQILPGYEAIIELDVPLDLKRSMESKRKGGVHFEAVSPTFMDYRLFILNNEIYLHINADTVIVSRLELRGKGFGDDIAYKRDIDTCTIVAEKAGEMGNWEEPCRLENLYGGDNLQVTLMRQFNTIWSGGIYGKNYALFGIPNATHSDAPDSIYAELDIFPHHVQQILPEEHNKIDKQVVFERIWKPGTSKRRKFKIDRVNMREVKEVGNTTESSNPPLPSFSTVDAHEKWFPGEAVFKEAAHGGACCVSFSADELNVGGTKNNHHESLLVGIGHTKVTWKPWYSRANVPQAKKDLLPHTHYVSLFYAFDPHPPFHVRARSGYFCLGHAPLATGNELPPTEGGKFNPHSILTRNRMLQQNNVTFDCPQMSFISSFIEKVGDSSSTVIGYGLNDCTGRLVEVEKEEIVRLLYPDPMDMIFE